MNEETLLALVAEISSRDIDNLSMETELLDLQWDSLSTLTFLAKVDQLHGLAVDADRLSSAKTVREVFELVSGR
jgi:acyl carrier protein